MDNNPIRLVDLTGKAPTDPIKSPKIRPTTNSGVKGGMYGMTRSQGTKEHNGVDILAPKGSSFMAIKGGTVIGNMKKGKDGNLITVMSKLSNGKTLFTTYSHLESLSPLKVGSKVAKGSVLGKTGTTGNGDVPKAQEHLHVTTSVSEDGTWKNKVSVDPLQFFDTEFSSDGNVVEGSADGVDTDEKPVKTPTKKEEEEE